MEEAAVDPRLERRFRGKVVDRRRTWLNSGLFLDSFAVLFSFSMSQAFPVVVVVVVSVAARSDSVELFIGASSVFAGTPSFLILSPAGVVVVKMPVERAVALSPGSLKRCCAGRLLGPSSPKDKLFGIAEEEPWWAAVRLPLGVVVGVGVVEGGGGIVVMFGRLSIKGRGQNNRDDVGDETVVIVGSLCGVAESLVGGPGERPGAGSLSKANTDVVVVAAHPITPKR